MATTPILTFAASGQTQTSTVPVVNIAFNPPLAPGKKVTIVLVVQDQAGNKSQPLQKTLTVQAAPTAGFTTTPTDTVIPGQPIKADATSSGPAGVTLTFNWTANIA